MPRSFEMSADYSAAVDDVHGAFTDKQYWLARLDASGADETSLDTMVVGADGSVRVTTTQTIYAHRLPGVVSQLHRGDLSLVRDETWTPVAFGRANATVSGSIPGAPASLTGTATLAATAGGTQLQVRAEVTVRIPLLGGKVETMIGAQLVELLVAEQRFTTAWIGDKA